MNKTNSLLVLLLFSVTARIGAQEAGASPLSRLDSLIQTSRDLIGKKDFDQALEINLTAEKLALENFGANSAEYGRTCYNHGRVFDFKDDFNEAKEWYEKALNIMREANGKDHPDYGSCLHGLGTIYHQQRQFDKAEPLYLEARSVRKKVIGKMHKDYAKTLNNLALLYTRLRRFELAEQVNLETIAIKEKTLGKDHPEYGKTLNNLALLYNHMGEYDKAEQYYLETKTIWGNSLGNEHPLYGQVFYNLGKVYHETGQFELAVQCNQQAINIWAKALGTSNPNYALALNNQATTFLSLGHFAKCEKAFLELQPLRKKISGRESEEYACVLNNLGLMYKRMGQYNKAEELYLEAKEIMEGISKQEHPYYSNMLDGLGSVYSYLGQWEKVEPLFKEAKDIKERTLGSSHYAYAGSLNNLGNLYNRMGQAEKAEPLILEATEILKSHYGRDHPSYGKTLNNLAFSYLELGNHSKAEELYIEGRSIMEKTIGKEHLSYAQCLNNMEALYRSTGNYSKAEPLYYELARLNRSLTEKAMLHLSEREMSNYMSLFSLSEHQMLSFAQKNKSEVVVPACFDNSLFYKGFLLQSSLQIRQIAQKNPETSEKFNYLKGYQRRLAAQYALPISERDESLIVNLESKSNELEKELARTVSGYSEAKRQVNWKEVQSTLKKGEVAVEFVHYIYYDQKKTDSTMYAAIVLHPGNSNPKFIPLFEQKSLDSLLFTSGERKADYVSGLYTWVERGIKPVGQSTKSLYDLIWSPLKNEMEGVNTIYFSPTGLLHRINLGAVPINDESTISDNYQLQALNSTRQLVIKKDSNSKGQEALLYGGVQYIMDSTAIVEANGEIANSTFNTNGSGVDFAKLRSVSRGDSWDYLKWTDKEVEKIAMTLIAAGINTNVRRAYFATEESFKTIGIENPSPRILHLATHGFFFPDPSNSEALSDLKNQSAFKLSDHPMIRSGLILAGGNHAWQNGEPLNPDLEDGILTAYEVSQVNLSNTELVVLSACETGLGDIQRNEGVYGLQRAFKVAGAKYLIMSLWQVPDQETSIFMEAFYKHWMEDKMTIPVAFHTTQKEMRERFLNPFQWAGFVLIE